MRRSLTWTLALALIVVANAAAPEAQAHPVSLKHQGRHLRHSAAKHEMSQFAVANTIVHLRTQVSGLHLLMGKPMPRAHLNPWRTTRPLRLKLLHFWRDNLTVARVQVQNPPHRVQWLCIQRNETGPPFPAWQTASGNDYYGGLQMDMTFQRNYGARLLRTKGTANHWSAIEQMWVAEHGLAKQGWSAWPKTSHACGYR